MLESANREIGEAAVAQERRREVARRLPALIAALDDLLFELEDLNLRGVTAVPAACRERAGELLAETSRRGSPPDVPAAVADLMDLVYEAQEVALVRRRRAALGIDEPAPARSA
ncbi:MAG TPA: hypothetical protein VIC57_06320 [Candidatus Dormibacteraeota bacterium]|jgi:hypothetical protein